MSFSLLSPRPSIHSSSTTTSDQDHLLPLHIRRYSSSSTSHSSFQHHDVSLQGGGQEYSSHQRQEQRSKVFMSCALFATYFTVMGAKCALPSTFALLTSQNSGLLNEFQSSPSHIISQTLTLSTMSIALGKILLGPVIDSQGGVKCLQIALGSLMTCMLVISSTSSFKMFAVTWIMVDFIFSSCWAACLNAIHGVFLESDWPGKIGELAVAGRVGNACSFILFSFVLNQVQKMNVGTGVDGSWRWVFFCSGLMQIIPLILFSCFQTNKRLLQEDNQEEHVETSAVGTVSTTSAQSRPTIQDSLKVLQTEAKRVSFWMHLVSRSCLMIIASFLLFVPSYMNQAFEMTSSQAAWVGSLYALGSLLSVSFGAKRFTSFTIQKKLWSVVGLLGSLCGICILHLGYISSLWNMTPIMASTSMFLWGVAFSIPFYIPPSMYALKRGGRKSSATIADAFDLVGFMLLAGFNGFVASRKQDVLMEWFKPFGVLLGCSIVSLLTLLLGLVFDE
ncbi:hypothetical protein CTEN210_18196 [Chaetoceros tenuissimus]|uniref:Uncharacterized protein n=1 Tax=Chaetoceros tenuissimus TaxID=426638 RepID=A0AAD3DEV6_9STRA|nr:hypothetical protein CTEN210_18196 [Chaetoceros tenuissimus]